MKILVLAFLIAGASIASAQTTLNTGAAECGVTAAFKCVSLPVYGGGTLWISSNGSYSHFVQFSVPVDGDGDALVGTATNLVATTEIVTPITTQTAPNAFVLHLLSFSYTDSAGEFHSGSGTIHYHYRYATGSGRGGGGSGWHLVADSGTIKVS